MDVRVSVCWSRGLRRVCLRVALLIQHETRMRLLASSASLAPTHVSTLSHKYHDF